MAISPDGEIPIPKRKKGATANNENGASKRRKLENSTETPDIHSEVLLLESQIVGSRLHYNHITTLLEYASSKNGSDERDVVAAVALCRVFCKLMVQGSLVHSPQASENEITITKWLLQRYQDYQKTLFDLLSSEAPRQSTALTLIMRLLKDEATYLKVGDLAIWQSGIFPRLIAALSESGQAQEARVEFAEKYLEQYHDVRYYCLKELSTILKTSSSANVTTNVLALISSLESIPENEDDLDPTEKDNFYLTPPSIKKHKILQLTAHKKQAQGVWVSLLRQDLDRSHRKRILLILSEQIAPWFLQPELLLDFLIDSFDAGGATSLMALSGLFFLMREKNLDYPNFYRKLYSMLDADLLHSKHRSRFFRLLDTFLASTHLPATLVASFMKRMARLAINAPPSAIVAVVPWVYNLLRSHPSCTFMIHRQHSIDDSEDDGYRDPFNMQEPDPTMTNAIESSLWEIHMLQSHYHPNVATVCKIISEQFTKQSYNIEDFLDHSYASMLEAELGRHVKKAAEIEFQIPKRIFLRDNSSPGVCDNILTNLWDFG